MALGILYHNGIRNLLGGTPVEAYLDTATQRKITDRSCDYQDSSTRGHRTVATAGGNTTAITGRVGFSIIEFQGVVHAA